MAALHPVRHDLDASMRPPEFTGGNVARCDGRIVRPPASMRPPEFTGGNGYTDLLANRATALQ